MTARVDNLYHGCCDHFPDSENMITLTDEADRYLEALIREVFDEQDIPDNDPELLRAYGTKLADAVAKGYGNDLDAFEWDGPDYATMYQLQNNVWQFSAAKTHTQLRDMGRALIGPDGKIRSFEEFKIAAHDISKEQMRWLRTEYDSALGAAQMAAKWQHIIATKDQFPLLEFDAVIDENSSDICPPLDKIILPVEHVFWLKYYPPNHYKCRSTVRQLSEGKITPDKDIVYPESISPLFDGNVGATGIIFPKDHPYYTDVPAHIVNNATLYMPPIEQYLVKYKAKNGMVVVNRKTDIEQGADLPDLMKAAKVLADDGKQVNILPTIHAAETELRDALLPDAKDGKNPDMAVNGEYTELKTSRAPTYERLQQLLAKASVQANRAIVVLEEEYSEAAMRGVAENRFKVYPDMEEIGFVTIDGEYIEFLNHKRQ